MACLGLSVGSDIRTYESVLHTLLFGTDGLIVVLSVYSF